MAVVFVVIFSAPIIGENIEALYPVVRGLETLKLLVWCYLQNI